MSDQPNRQSTPGPKGPRWLPMTYYYLAALVGLITFMFSLINGLQGFRQFLLPESSDQVIYADDRFSAESGPGTVRGNNLPSDAEQQRRHEEAKEDAIEEAKTVGLGRAIDGALGSLVAFPIFAWHLRRVRKKEPEWLGTSPESDGDKAPSP